MSFSRAALLPARVNLRDHAHDVLEQVRAEIDAEVAKHLGLFLRRLRLVRNGAQIVLGGGRELRADFVEGGVGAVTRVRNQPGAAVRQRVARHAGNTLRLAQHGRVVLAVALEPVGFAAAPARFKKRQIAEVMTGRADVRRVPQSQWPRDQIPGQRRVLATAQKRLGKN